MEKIKEQIEDLRKELKSDIENIKRECERLERVIIELQSPNKNVEEKKTKEYFKPNNNASYKDGRNNKDNKEKEKIESIIKQRDFLLDCVQRLIHREAKVQSIMEETKKDIYAKEKAIDLNQILGDLVGIRRIILNDPRRATIELEEKIKKIRDKK